MSNWEFINLIHLSLYISLSLSTFPYNFKNQPLLVTSRVKKTICKLKKSAFYSTTTTYYTLARFNFEGTN